MTTRRLWLAFGAVIAASFLTLGYAAIRIYQQAPPGPPIVIEYGVVNLFGLSLRQRADALISIAHADVRNDLRREFAQARHMVVG